MTASHSAWLFHADQDLLSMRALLKEECYAHACFHAQQAVEKAMKAYLAAHDIDIPRIHGLLELLDRMRVEWLTPHIVEIRKLSDFYTPIRYPDTIAGALPRGLPSQQLARNAVGWAETIVDVIKSQLPK